MREQILIATPVYDRMHVPQLWLLNENADDISLKAEIENRSIQDLAEKTKKPFVSQINKKTEESKTTSQVDSKSTASKSTNKSFGTK